MGKRQRYFILGGVLVICIFIFIIVQYLLMYNENYFPSNIKKVLTEKVQITVDEQLSVELILSVIDDYKTDIEKQPDWLKAIVVEGEGVLESKSLESISKKVLTDTNSIFHTNFTQNELFVEVYQDKLTYCFWMEEFFYMVEYRNNGDIEKHLSTRRIIPFKGNEIVYYFHNRNNEELNKIKMISK